MLYVIDVKAVFGCFIYRVLGQIIEATTDEGLNLLDATQEASPYHGGRQAQVIHGSGVKEKQRTIRGELPKVTEVGSTLLLDLVLVVTKRTTGKQRLFPVILSLNYHAVIRACRPIFKQAHSKVFPGILHALRLNEFCKLVVPAVARADIARPSCPDAEIAIR